MKCSTGLWAADLQRVAHLGELLPRFLVAVLAEVPHPEVVEQEHVGGREELRHDDERDLLGIASRGGAGALDPGVHGSEGVGQLIAPGPGTAHRVASVDIVTTPAKRPVTPSRRYE